MAKRFEIDAVFRAIDHMTGPIRRMSASLGAFASNAEARVGGFKSRWQDETKPIREFGAVVGRATLAGAVVAGAALKDVVEVGADFEQTLAAAGSKFADPIRIGTEQFDELRKAAEDVGANTEFTASQAAGALRSLGAAGEDASAAMSVLGTVGNLATVAQVDLDTATSLAIGSMNALGLATDDATQKRVNYARTADLMAKTDALSDTNITELSEAVSKGGLAFIKSGQSAEGFLATVALLGTAGIKGSRAGGDAARIVTSLTAARGRGEKELKKLRFQPFNKDKTLKDFDVMMDEIQASMNRSGMTLDEQAVSWGKIVGEESRAAAMALVEKGMPKLREMRSELQNATDYAQQAADMQRETTLGALKNAESMMEAIKLEVFDAVKDDVTGILEATRAWGAENKEAIGEGFRGGLRWLRENIDAIITSLKVIGTLVLAFKAMDAAIKAAELSLKLLKATQMAYNLAVSGAPKLVRALGAAYEYLTTKTAAGAAVQKTLNTNVGELESKTSKAGAAVGVLAAAYAGFEAGSFIDEQTGISDTLSRMIEHTLTARDALLDLQDVQAATTAGELKDQLRELRDEQKMAEQAAGAGTFAFGVGGLLFPAVDELSGREAERTQAIASAEARLAETTQVAAQVRRQRGDAANVGAAAGARGVASLGAVAEGADEATRRALAPTVIAMDAYRGARARAANAGAAPGAPPTAGREVTEGEKLIVEELRKLANRKDAVDVTVEGKGGAEAKAKTRRIKPSAKVQRTGGM